MGPRFWGWCEAHGIQEFSSVEPIHIAAFVKTLEKEFSAPTVKQHLAAPRLLFDWLVTCHVLEVNPAHAVRDGAAAYGSRRKGGNGHQVPFHHRLDE